MAGDLVDGDASAHPVLDAAQLVRIEATHRGFFYQHLFAVECMLDMSPAGTQVVVVENDEDVELVGDGFRVYIQVKTRSRKIQFSDVESALDRFSSLRKEHSQGRRSGAARFALVVNEEPGPDLQQRLGEQDWPGDVAFISPGASVNAVNLAVPRPWPTIGSGLAACEAKAALVPFSTLAPATLVFKLAGLAQGARGNPAGRGQLLRATGYPAPGLPETSAGLPAAGRRARIPDPEPGPADHRSLWIGQDLLGVARGTAPPGADSVLRCRRTACTAPKLVAWSMTWGFKVAARRPGSTR